MVRRLADRCRLFHIWVPPGRRRLGARIPANPCSSVPFAPSLRPVLARGRRGLGARIPANPCSSVPFTPSLGLVLACGRRGLGARISAKPCSSVCFAPSLRTFSARGRRDLVHESPQSLVLPFSLHQVSGHFRPARRASPRRSNPADVSPACSRSCARRALFAVMLFINLQKRYNEMARLARGRFGRRKGTRSKQFITGGIKIGERTCLTKSLV